MNEHVFDHDRLDVYRLSIEYTSDASKGMAININQKRKIKLARIVSMLTRMAMKFENISEPESAYSLSSDYDYEHEHRLRLSTNLM